MFFFYKQEDNKEESLKSSYTATTTSSNTNTINKLDIKSFEEGSPTKIKLSKLTEKHIDELPEKPSPKTEAEVSAFNHCK